MYIDREREREGNKEGMGRKDRRLAVGPREV